MTGLYGNRLYRGFTVKDLAVIVTCLLIAAGLLTSLAGANRDLSQASVCTSNLETLFGGLMAYVNTYNSYPPHSPYPSYQIRIGGPGGIDSPGIDPSIGWIMTYGLAMPPPATYANGHFQWFVLNPNELPSICTCPAANYDLLFTPNPEIDTNNLESFTFQYAAFYQTSGACRSATPLIRIDSFGKSYGGRNAPIADPTSSVTGKVASNSSWGIPYVWVSAKGTGDPLDPNDVDTERNCWVQAVHPAEVQEPGRVYYLADSREYRPTSAPYDWPSGAICNGWYNGWGNLVFMGTRHYGYANVMYLDGQVNRDNQAHPIARWNMDYDVASGKARSSQWRCSTFADPISIAGIGTQHHIMPVLMVQGWETFFNADGIAAR